MSNYDQKSAHQLFWNLFPFLKQVLFYISLALRLYRTNDLSLSCRQQVLLGLYLLSFSVHYPLFSTNELFSLDPVVVIVHGGFLPTLPVWNIAEVIFVFHHFVQSEAPFFLQKRLEELFLMRNLKWTWFVKVFKNIVSLYWGYFSIKPVIIDFTFLRLRYILEGLVDLDKLLLALFAVIVILRVMLNGESPVSIFYLVDRCVSWYAQNFVACLCFLGIMLIEELRFFFIYEIVIVKKLFESLIGIF